jgi:hypothetical protein
VHNVVDISASRPIGIFQNSVCPADSRRGCARGHSEIGVKLTMGGAVGRCLRSIHGTPVTQSARNNCRPILVARKSVTELDEVARWNP